eukprot:Lithocolla_globosa_v1_NODE_152_length_5671_cov_121.982906.p4 type:complete len:111 gc:universal NODE_152_length_5671_cov_121.982906:616-284(-)
METCWFRVQQLRQHVNNITMLPSKLVSTPLLHTNHFVPYMGRSLSGKQHTDGGDKQADPCMETDRIQYFLTFFGGIWEYFGQCRLNAISKSQPIKSRDWPTQKWIGVCVP